MTTKEKKTEAVWNGGTGIVWKFPPRTFPLILDTADISTPPTFQQLGVLFASAHCKKTWNVCLFPVATGALFVQKKLRFMVRVSRLVIRLRLIDAEAYRPLVLTISLIFYALNVDRGR